MGNVPVNVMEVSGTGQRDHNDVSSYANGFSNPYGMIWGTDTSGAMSIYAVGASASSPEAPPTPAPTPNQTSYSGTNLAVFPADWSGIWSNSEVAFNANNNLDSKNLTPDGNPSCNMGPVLLGDSYNGYSYPFANSVRECDLNWIGLPTNTATSNAAGDTIVFSVWLKTGPSGGQDPNAGTGYDNPPLQIGWDWYGANGRIAASWTNAQQEDTAAILWNTGWTLITVKMTVPATITCDGTNSNYPSGQQVVPTGIYPWIGADSVDSGACWFGETTLYIIPSG